MNIVLAVNDEPGNLVLVTTQLLLMNYQVVTASVQQDAVDIARMLKPMLIIMDLILTDGNGWDAARIIKDDADLHDIPIIVLSARAESSDREHAILAGADAFLSKPYAIEDLRQLLHQYLTPAAR